MQFFFAFNILQTILYDKINDIELSMCDSLE